jgi:hypothetical protein
VAKLELFGSVTRERGNGCGGGCGPGGSNYTWPFDACIASPAGVVDVDRAINSVTDWIDLLAGSGIATLQFVHLMPTGGTFELRVSSALAADQVFPLGDILNFVAKTASQELTALAVRGSGRLYGLLGGR